MRLNPLAPKRRPIPIGLELPWEYLKAHVDILDPYKRKAYIAVGFGIATLPFLWLPGLFFVNPVTHIPNPEVTYISWLGVAVVAVIGLITLKAIDWYKDDEAAPFDIGQWEMTVRENYSITFHTFQAPFEKLDDTLVKAIMSLLDSKFKVVKEQINALAAVRPSDPVAQKTAETLKAQMVDLTELHAFYVPFIDSGHLADAIFLSTADTGDKLYHPFPGEESVVGHWIRHHPAAKYNVGVVDEYQFQLEGDKRVYTTPIVMACGTHYDFITLLQKALLPPVLNDVVTTNAKILCDGRVVGTEAFKQLQHLANVRQTNKTLQETYQNDVTNTAAYVVDLIERFRGRFNPEGSNKGTSRGRWRLGIALIVGSLLLIAGSFWLFGHH